MLVIAGSWTLVTLFSYVNTWFFVGDLVALGKLSGSYAFLPDFAGTLVIGVIGGLIGGYLLVYRLNAGYRHTTFMSGIVRSTVLFGALYLGVGVPLLFGLAAAASLPGGVGSALSAGVHNVVANVYTPSFLATMLFWGLLVASTQFMLQVADKFGAGVLWKFLTGAYYAPREEERVFMFLDLDSSTAIAERLGHRSFFEFLREVYQDVTQPISDCRGEIYQYVGDEVVVSWTPERGFEDRNCLRCFFRIEETMDAKRRQYSERFGVAPSFKAGLHIGRATVGEIGVMKKDIVYSGDVLNTTARIQGECRQHRAKLLVSGDLLARMAVGDAYHALPIGEIPLRGKARPLSLSVVFPA